MATRVSKHFGTINPKYDIKEFNKNDITKDNIVNHILVLKQEDVSSSLIMDLFGSFNGSELVHHYDTFEVPVGAFKFLDAKGKERSNSNKFTTTFGIWILNVFLFRDFNLSHIFGGYINKNLTKGAFEDMHQDLLYALIEDKITIDNYKKFIQACDFMMTWETILSPAQSEKLLACSKEIDKLKAKLIKENKEEIDKGNAIVAEKIENQLIDFAKEYLKDDPALDGYLSGAGGSIPNNFKNMYIMKGAIRNTDPAAKKEFDIATSSFIGGINKDEYSALAKSLTGGPYSRAKKTEIGGYWEKLMASAMNTIKMKEPGSDCKTDKYLEVTLSKNIIKDFMYNYIVKSDGSLEELTLDNKDKYLNKKVKFRSALFCKEFAQSGCLCNACVGNFFNRRGNPNVGLACASIPTVLKLKSMKAFHDSTVKSSEINPLKAFSLK